jgi:hypothetical protein
VIAQLSQPAFLPFSIAGGVMLGLLTLEILFLVVGKPLSALLDHLAGGHHGPEVGAADHAGPGDHAGPAHGKFAEALAWLNAGRVPGLILLILALAGFAAGGFVIQGIADAIFRPLPAFIASLGALALAVPFVRGTSRTIARLMPRDETYALTHGDLIGLNGVVTLGPVKQGVAAKARFRDHGGNTHFPRVEPFKAGEVIEEGAAVLAVEARGSVIAVTRAKPTLTGTVG